MTRPPSAAATSAFDRLVKIGERFHSVAQPLRLRAEHRSTLVVEEQQDVQDLFYALLRFEFEDVEREEWTPAYAGLASQVSFFVQQGQVVVIVKKTRVGRGGKEIAEELVMDGKRFASYPACRLVFCFVYDPEGRIGNSRGLEAQLIRRESSLTVQVLISPK